jgi:ubiquinone/menaquinone biosynthesis C-methylase UbiE
MLRQKHCDLELERIRDTYARRAAAIPADKYSMRNPATVCMVQERQRETLMLLKKLGADDLSRSAVLDIGCGSGSDLRQYITWGVPPENLTGMDLMEDRIATARKLCPERVTLICGSAHELPFADESFDVVSLSTVFSSVLDAEMRMRMAAESARVLRRGGFILWYDFWANNPTNHEVRGIDARQIRILFAGFEIHLRRVTVAPPLARIIAPHSSLTYSLLAAVKLFSTHQIGLFRKV